ncbi:MAG: c-type cytochrome, partial [Candidatus Kryptoniota bacterium]
VDKEYYIMQSEFYTTGNYGDPGLQQFDLSKALAEDPSYVVFNGSVGSLLGQSALHADVGQTVRLYVGNIGPNLVSSFHVIGEVFDKVYGEAGSQVTQSDVQTTLIPAGGAVIVDFTTSVPGTYTLVDHSIFRAFNKGCIGQLVVSGQQHPDIFSGKQRDEIYLGDQSVNSLTASDRVPESGSAVGLSENISNEDGASIYNRTCVACHQANAMGVPNVFPPLSGSDFLARNKLEAINFVLHGHSGPIVVNGKTYNNVMTPQPLNDEQIAKVLTYVRTHFGNHLSPVTPQEVLKVRQGGTPSIAGSN